MTRMPEALPGTCRTRSDTTIVCANLVLELAMPKVPGKQARTLAVGSRRQPKLAFSSQATLWIVHERAVYSRPESVLTKNGTHHTCYLLNPQQQMFCNETFNSHLMYKHERLHTQGATARTSNHHSAHCFEHMPEANQ